MKTHTETASFRRPSASIPIAMSATALVIVLVAITSRGPTPAADEGTAAHLFQLLLAGQAPIVAFFAIKWLPRDPAHALAVLGCQALAASLALLPVIVLGL
jgi:hypothetical protein